MGEDQRSTVEITNNDDQQGSRDLGENNSENEDTQPHDMESSIQDNKYTRMMTMMKVALTTEVLMRKKGA